MPRLYSNIYGNRIKPVFTCLIFAALFAAGEFFGAIHCAIFPVGEGDAIAQYCCLYRTGWDVINPGIDQVVFIFFSRNRDRYDPDGALVFDVGQKWNKDQRNGL